MEVRNATLADAAQILEIYSCYVTNTAISFEYGVPTLDDFKGRMERTLKNFPYLVAELDGQIIGYAYAGNCWYSMVWMEKFFEEILDDSKEMALTWESWLEKNFWRGIDKAGFRVYIVQA